MLRSCSELPRDVSIERGMCSRRSLLDTGRPNLATYLSEWPRSCPSDGEDAFRSARKGTSTSLPERLSLALGWLVRYCLRFYDYSCSRKMRDLTRNYFLCCSTAEVPVFGPQPVRSRAGFAIGPFHSAQDDHARPRQSDLSVGLPRVSGNWASGMRVCYKMDGVSPIFPLVIRTHLLLCPECGTTQGGPCGVSQDV